MAEVHVGLGDRSYEIRIGDGLIGDLGNEIDGLGLGRKCVVITDERVGRLYAEKAVKSLTGAGYVVGEVRLPEGEESKSLKNVERCYHEMLALGLDRKSFVVALGGGMIGDLAGFAAASFMRGIPFVQAPTTLLADVDASVGGKTGVNLREGKNLVGAFHQPRGVFIDIDTLRTLEKRDLKAGFVEALKHGLIRNRDYYDFVKESYEKILALDPKAMEHTILRSCEIKAAVVEEDERESGLRAILNFGHTVGHAVESLSIEVDKPYRHGEAVAIGIAAALELSVALGHLKNKEMQDVLDFMEECGMPVSCDFLEPERVMERMKADKKVLADKLRFVLLKGIGESFIAEDVPYDAVLEVVKARCSADG